MFFNSKPFVRRETYDVQNLPEVVFYILQANNHLLCILPSPNFRILV